MKKKNYSVMGLVQKAIIDSMNFSKRDESQIFIEISLMLMLFNSMLIKVDGIFLKKEYSTSISMHVVIYHPL